jgi:hypothetical protein
MVVAMFPQIQRKLQLQIEEQGQYLQKMFEKQREMEDDRIKAFASNPDDDKSVTSKPDQDKTGAHETKSTEDRGPGDGSDSNVPPTKRARADQTATSSTKPGSD